MPRRLSTETSRAVRSEALFTESLTLPETTCFIAAPLASFALVLYSP